MNNLFQKTIILIFCIISFLNSASIQGTIRDKETKAPLIGANVFIDETSQGSATDFEGLYLIEDIKACETCKYTLKVLYIGYEEYSTTIEIKNDSKKVVDLLLSSTSLEVETTKVTAKKRQDKITEAPAAIELVSAKDIKKEESTNLGSYLKGIKGVDFTSSGVNNYSISVRGFNSSFTSRLLTLTDGRIANIPALRVVNYSTVPQSSKDIEAIEIVLGPSSALYGANAHSGVVNIISKSPADSEGLDISISSSVADDRDLYKFSSRWANKINEKLSFKLSTMYLQANEWEFISEGEYQAHTYPWAGNPERIKDGKDNNPYKPGAAIGDDTSADFGEARQDTMYKNYLIDGGYSSYVQDSNDCRTLIDEGNGEDLYACEQIIKYIGNGDPNDTGDPDGDGFMGEDWFNGYDDDGDCPGDTNNDGVTCGPGDEGVDEDYFFSDGIDNGGEIICEGDSNGDGIVCGAGDIGVDEQIDDPSDQWFDGADNNKNGLIDEEDERYGNDQEKFYVPDWSYDLQFTDIIVSNGRLNEWICSTPTDIDACNEENGYYNQWYTDGSDTHLRGNHYYDEEAVKMLFDVFVYDFGNDSKAGDLFVPFDPYTFNCGNDELCPWDEGYPGEDLNEYIDYIDDISGEGFFFPSEGGNILSISSGDYPISHEGCDAPLGQTFCTDQDINPNWSQTESGFIDYDCGFDGLCPLTMIDGNMTPTPDYPGPDYGEGNGVWDSFDWNSDGQWGFSHSYDENNNLILEAGDEWDIDSWAEQLNDGSWIIINDDGDGVPSINDSIFLNGEGTTWNDIYPAYNNQLDWWETLRDCGQDGLCEDHDEWPGADSGENDGILEMDTDGSELDNKFDTGDSCFGCDAEPFIDANGNGYWDCPGGICEDFTDTNDDGQYTHEDYKDNFRTVRDLNGDGYDDYPDFEVKNAKTEFRVDFDPNPDLNLTFQTGYSWSKLQQVTGTGRYLADGYKYTYYQLRSRYKNWFSQIYLNQGNSGETRGYDLGNVISDESRNMAFQLQHNFDFKNTKFIWGIDFFRTEAKTNGTILGDGPNGYDNDGDSWLHSKDNIDNDYDSDDFSDWGIDGIGQYQTNSFGDLLIDQCENCETIVAEGTPNATYDSTYNIWFLDGSGDGDDDGNPDEFADGVWSNYNSCFPFLCNEEWTGPDYGEGNGIPDAGELININIGDAEYNVQTGNWEFNTNYNYNVEGDFWYDQLIQDVDTGDGVYNTSTSTWDFIVDDGINACFDYDSQLWYECGSESNTNLVVDPGHALLNIHDSDYGFLTFDECSSLDDSIYYTDTEIELNGVTVGNCGNGIIEASWTFDNNYNHATGLWYTSAPINSGDLIYNGTLDGTAHWGSNTIDWFNDIDGDGIYDPGEPGVNQNGFVIVDGVDNDCDACDYDGDGWMNFQEIHLNTNIYDPTDHPDENAVNALGYEYGIDELIDENYCGNYQYDASGYIPSYEYGGWRAGKEWRCDSEGVDEENEFIEVTSNELGFYFQTKTIPKRNKKWEIITAARFDHHDQLDEEIQFAPKFGIFYKPNSLQTFRLTYGKAYNTPSALTLHTDLYIGKRGIVEYYLRGNKDGTPYLRVGEELQSSIPQINIDGNLHILTGGTIPDNYFEGEPENGIPDYKTRINRAPYFLGFNTEFSSVPEFIPLDTLLYTVWVPELTDEGRIYTPLEALNISDVDPINTEKIQTLELGFKGFVSEKIHLTADYYISYYEDFFSSPTVITPLIIKRIKEENEDGKLVDITSFDNIQVVGMLPVNYNLSNPPYATQWDGRDNDNDYHYSGNLKYFDNHPLGAGRYSYDNPLLNCQEENGGCFGDWYDFFGWGGYNEWWDDTNENGMYDFGENFHDDDENGEWNCVNCSGEWGFIKYIENATGQTIGYTIMRPEDVVDTGQAINEGIFSMGDYAEEGKNWEAVGVDEFDPENGMNEAEQILSPVVDPFGNRESTAATAFTPLHSVLAPMNYGKIWMQGIDIGLTYLFPTKKITMETNFSFYKSTDYYNELTKKNDPINAPKFKMNASIGWQSPIGDIAVKYRHVDKFEWKDGIWAGMIGPYNIFDLHWNYKVNRYLELNVTGLNIFDDQHKEMVGGAKMGRQMIVRLTASI